MRDSINGLIAVSAPATTVFDHAPSLRPASTQRIKASAKAVAVGTSIKRTPVSCAEGSRPNMRRAARLLART